MGPVSLAAAEFKPKPVVESKSKLQFDANSYRDAKSDPKLESHAKSQPNTKPFADTHTDPHANARSL